ncbi:MAG: MHS family MFS transporter [Streptosporangiales bacterium]|nr:MHS family MFS transporter [Streptosporangiales bacterium]
MALRPNGADGGETPDRGQIRLAAAASLIGTTIEWYDYFLYGTAAAVVFPAVFFPASSSYSGTLDSFATYAVGFAARPIGAAIFGHWGDRLGRKATLIITLLMMGIGSALVGCLPGAGSIGVAAPILLVVLRVIQGVAIGGEWSGSVLLSMETGDQRKRGLMAAWPQAGVACGLLLGTGMMTAIALSDPSGFQSFGWRIPFLFSLVLVAIGLWIRLRVMETPMFKRVIEQNEVSKVPTAEVLKKHPKEIVLSAFLRMSEQAPFYVYTTFVLDYLKTHLNQTEGVALGAISIAAAFELFATPFFGHLSDRVGRRRLYVTGSLLTAVVAFPLFLLVNTGNFGLVIVGLLLIACGHSMQYGPQAAYIAESFPARLGYAGSGLGYQAASLIAGGPAPLLAAWMLANYGWQAISIYIICCSVLTLIAAALLPDRSKADLMAPAAAPAAGQTAGG